MYTKKAIVRYFEVTTSKSRLLKTISENFASYGLQKSGDAFLKTLASGVDFLGWVHFSCHRILRTATKKRMFRRIDEIQGMGVVVASYLGLLGYGNTRRLQEKMRTACNQEPLHYS
ncbi:MAG: hypothetical protein WAZ40_00520 [Minisyncoccia bacterium]